MIARCRKSASLVMISDSKARLLLGLVRAFFAQEGGAAAKKVKTEDDPSKIDWQQALAQGQVYTPHRVSSRVLREVHALSVRMGECTFDDGKLRGRMSVRAFSLETGLVVWMVRENFPSESARLRAVYLLCVT